MRLITAILARNEGEQHRYFRRVLDHCLAFSDTVLVLDDRSEDATASIATLSGCVVRTRTGRPAWGEESPARKELWEFACEHATEPDDFILICDADMILHGDVRSLCESTEVNTWSFILYDLWSETHYRSDGFWQGHRVHRPWLFAPNRVPDGWVAEWPERGIHCGHAPQNWPILDAIAPQQSHYYYHFAYATPELRVAKSAQYLAKAHLLTPFERAHAESILAPP